MFLLPAHVEVVGIVVALELGIVVALELDRVG